MKRGSPSGRSSTLDPLAIDFKDSVASLRLSSSTQLWAPATFPPRLMTVTAAENVFPLFDQNLTWPSFFPAFSLIWSVHTM